MGRPDGSADGNTKKPVLLSGLSRTTGCRAAGCPPAGATPWFSWSSASQSSRSASLAVLAMMSACVACSSTMAYLLVVVLRDALFPAHVVLRAGSSLGRADLELQHLYLMRLPTEGVACPLLTSSIEATTKCTAIAGVLRRRIVGFRPCGRRHLYYWIRAVQGPFPVARWSLSAQTRA